MLTLKVFVEESGKAPQLGKPGDAGLDCFAYLPGRDELVNQFGMCKIPLGFRYAFWDSGVVVHDHYISIENRSGVGTKSGMVPVAQICDASYRGIPHYCAVKVIEGEFWINDGDKIAQAIIHPFVDPYKIKIQVVKTIQELGSSERGDAGFGSSGRV